MKKIRVFVSSPGDVGQERSIARRVLTRLDANYGDAVSLDSYFWEYEPYVITQDYQAQIPCPGDFDIFLCILWSRLGNRLDEKYTLPPDHKRVARSGTEYEFVSAAESYRENQTPDLLVWVNQTVPTYRLDDPESEEKRLQWEQLQHFITAWTRDKKEKVFTGAINPYSNKEEFEDELEIKLRKLIDRRLDEDAEARQSRPAWEGNPYRGLHCFDYEHASLFFGRTAEVDSVISLIQQRLRDVWTGGPDSGSEGRSNSDRLPRAFAMVFGASGSGKSSLVRAGVLPMLAEGNSVEGVGEWRCAVLKPSEGGDNLMLALAAALSRDSDTVEDPNCSLHDSSRLPAALPELLSDGETAVSLASRFSEFPQAVLDRVLGALSQAANVLHAHEKQALQGSIEKEERSNREHDADLLRQRLSKLKPKRVCIVLLVDQLEELFTGNHPPAAVERFLTALEALASSGRAAVVTTLRSEFFPACERFPILMHLKEGTSSIHLSAPKAEAMGQILRSPARAAGVAFEEHVDKGRLEDRILQAALNDSDSLPLLQFCLERLYESGIEEGLLAHAEYERIGKLEGVLSQHAEEIYTQRLTADQRESFGAVMLSLASVGEKDGQFVRRTMLQDELVSCHPSAAGMVRIFLEARLFTSDISAEGEAIISVTHEALLHHWERLTNQLTKKRASLKTRAAISGYAKHWLEQERHRDYRYRRGVQLEDAVQLLRDGYLDAMEREFIEFSMKTAAEETMMEGLSSEAEYRDVSGRIRPEFPEVWKDVMSSVARNGCEDERCRVADLLMGGGDAEIEELLISLLVEDGSEKVRRAAARSVAVGGNEAQFERLKEIGRGQRARLVGPLAQALAAADMQKERPPFMDWFDSLGAGLRSSLLLRSWLLRFRRALPVFLFVVTPAMVFAVMGSAVVKWLPAMFNYSCVQATSSLAMGLFHSAPAGIFLGGGIVTGLTLYRMVFGREHGRFSFIKPVGSLMFGISFGVISGAFCVVVIAGVYDPNSLWGMGWTPTAKVKPDDLMRTIFLENRTGLVFPLTSMGLGIAVSLMVNGLRASKKWTDFLESQEAVASLSQLGRITREIIRLTLPYGVLIPVFVGLFGGIALIAVNSADEEPSWSLPPMKELFLGGMMNTADSGLGHDEKAAFNQAEEIRRVAWKNSFGGRLMGIAGDSIAKIVGGYLCVVGMGLGIVALRHGIRIEARRTS